MAVNETPVHIVGNLTADPELRFTQAGAAVAGFTVASTPRQYDQRSGRYEDLDPMFMRCSVWRDQAENVAESLRKGDRVIVIGRLRQRSFETRDGEKRTVIECEADDVGPGLMFGTAEFRKVGRGGGGDQRDRRDDDRGSRSRGRDDRDRGRGRDDRRDDRRGGGRDDRDGGYDDPWGSAPPAAGPVDDDEPPF